jgi:hypothetical protein
LKDVEFSLGGQHLLGFARNRSKAITPAHYRSEAKESQSLDKSCNVSVLSGGVPQGSVGN